MEKLSVLNKFVYFLNSIAALLLLFSCIVPHISIERLSALSILSLTVPILVLINIIFLLYWTFGQKKQLVLSLTVLVLGYFLLGSFFNFKFSKENILEEDLSVMTYNVRGFNKYNWIEDTSLGDQIIDFVKEEDPDILCFQEFSRIRNRQLKHYPYHYITSPSEKNKSIQAIYSKYPIITKGSLGFPDTSNNAIYVDIKYNKDTIRVYNLHLQSLKVIPKAEAISKEPSSRLYRRLSKTFMNQQKQAEIVFEHSENIAYKKIICGDFNNNQFSNVYHIIKGEMKDTFEKLGTGYGRTYNFEYYPVRIDFIFVDKDLEVKAHKNYDVKLSDHFPVMASIKL
ncbi:endonuclease/exonuclease/phosphatase family protein [Sediminicola luteus]|uniref:Endonuclease/exonuclease/phosphatase family protein n=1 Tax=Sediminicola luteus TaxID=319238 RepID=A0ABV2TRT5_9FLAO